MIIQPEELNFSNKNIIMIISGAPGTGKSTLALSAPDALIIDTDRGIARVNPAHRKASIQVNTYAELLADLEEIKRTQQYKTLIIDTAGELIELLKEWAIQTEPSARKKNGGVSLQGYGVVKSEFIRLSAELRKLYNVIFVFHTAREKNGDDVSYELVCEGAARTMVWQPTDLGAYLQIINGERFLGFTPTEQYNAKSAYGIKGLVRLPELKDGEKNTFLTGLFDTVRRNLDSESAAYVKDKERYDKAMAEGTELLKSINTPDDIDNVSKALAAIDHALTSETELKQAIMRQLNGKGWMWDKKAKQWTKASE